MSYRVPAIGETWRAKTLPDFIDVTVHIDDLTADGGWLGELHGLETRVATDATAWTAACLTLYRVCGTGPWQPPYSCANRPLPVLNPEGPTS